MMTINNKLLLVLLFSLSIARSNANDESPKTLQNTNSLLLEEDVIANESNSLSDTFNRVNPLQISPTVSENAIPALVDLEIMNISYTTEEVIYPQGDGMNLGGGGFFYSITFKVTVKNKGDAPFEDDLILVSNFNYYNKLKEYRIVGVVGKNYPKINQRRFNASNFLDAGEEKTYTLKMDTQRDFPSGEYSFIVNPVKEDFFLEEDHKRALTYRKTNPYPPHPESNYANNRYSLTVENPWLMDN